MTDAKHLARLYDMSVDMLGVAGFDGWFRMLNIAWEATLGHSREELMARPYMDFVHPDDRAQTEAAARKVTVDPLLLFENRYIHKDGTYRWLSWNARPRFEEQLIYFTARDVTDRKALEAQVQASAARFQDIFRHLPSTVMELDRDARILEINRVLAGMKREDVLGSSAYDHVPPDDAATCREAFGRVLRTGEPARYETRGPSPDGGEAWYESLVGPLRRGDEVTGMLLITSDITERRRLEAQHRASLAQVTAYAAELQRQNGLLEAEIEERMRAEARLEDQQRTIRAMSAPIIRAWRGVLVLPLVGAMDAARAALLMEALLEAIVGEGAGFTVLDLTGVQAMDAETAEHLLRIARAAGLLGSTCFLSGISPAIARMMVAIGADLGRLQTFAQLEDALRHAILREDGKGARNAL